MKNLLDNNGYLEAVIRRLDLNAAITQKILDRLKGESDPGDVAALAQAILDLQYRVAQLENKP